MRFLITAAIIVAVVVIGVVGATTTRYMREPVAATATPESSVLATPVAATATPESSVLATPVAATATPESNVLATPVAVTATPDPEDQYTTIATPVSTPPSERGVGRSQTPSDSDRYVQFSTHPVVCRGVLSFAGELRNGADWRGGDWTTFLLSHRDQYDMEGNTKVFHIYASILEPLTGGTYYSNLTERDLMADKYSIRGNHFSVEVDYTDSWLEYPDSGKIFLNVWGKVGSVDSGKLLRSTRIATC